MSTSDSEGDASAGPSGMRTVGAEKYGGDELLAHIISAIDNSTTDRHFMVKWGGDDDVKEGGYAQGDDSDMPQVNNSGEGGTGDAAHGDDSEIPQGAISEVKVRRKRNRKPQAEKAVFGRERKPEQWKQNVAQRLRNQGKEYVSPATQKVMPARMIGAPCKDGCFSKVGEEGVNALFKHFWQIGNYDAQNAYLQSCIMECQVKKKQVKKEQTQRPVHYKFFVTYGNEVFEVCRAGFIAIHGIGEKKVKILISKRKAAPAGLVIPVDQDRRGRHTPHNAITGRKLELVHEHVQTAFATDSPGLQTSQGRNLGVGAIIADLYQKYLQWMNEEHPQESLVTERFYRDVFHKYHKKPTGTKDESANPVILPRCPQHTPGIWNPSICEDSDRRKDRPVLNVDQEKRLADYLEKASDLYCGLTPSDCKEFVYQLFGTFGFKCPQSWRAQECADHDWFSEFIEKHENIKLRNPENADEDTERDARQQREAKFHEKLGQVLVKYKFSPKDVYCVDEVNYTVGCLSGNRDTVFTVAGIIVASGDRLPCYVCPSEIIDENKLRMTDSPGSKAISHPTGQITSKNFVKVLEHIKQHSKCSVKHPILLIMDNSKCHISAYTMNYAKENGIVLLVIPPHAPNKPKSLDTCVYGPLKSLVNHEINDWQTRNPKKQMQCHELRCFIDKSWKKAASTENVKKVFSLTGIYPYSRNMFCDSDSTHSVFLNSSECLIDDIKIDVHEEETDPLSLSAYEMPVQSPSPSLSPAAKSDVLEVFDCEQRQASIAMNMRQLTELRPCAYETMEASQQQRQLTRDSSLMKTKRRSKKSEHVLLSAGKNTSNTSVISTAYATDCEHGTGTEDEFENTPIQFIIEREPAPGDYVVVTLEEECQDDIAVCHIAKILREAPKDKDYTVQYLRLSQRQPGPSLFSPKMEDKTEVYRYQIISILATRQNTLSAQKSQGALYHLDKNLLAGGSCENSQSSSVSMNHQWQSKIVREGLNKTDMMEAIQTYAEKHSEVTIKTHSSKENFSIALVTDFMKRCHIAFEETQKICYIESAMHHNIINTYVTFFMGTSPAGVVPLGMIFSSDQDTDAYTTGFRLLKEALGAIAFNGKLQPEAFMIPDNEDIRLSLEIVWPGSHPLLCGSQFLQSVWRRFVEPKYKIPESDLHQLVKAVRDLISSSSPQKYASTLTDLLEGELVHYKPFINYVKRFARRKYEWSLAYQRAHAVHRSYTDNCCEPAMYIFKFIVMSRCKIYNTAALVMYMSEIFSGYLQQRYLDRVSENRQKLFSQRTIDDYDITELGNQSFFLKSKSEETSYSVDLKLGICSCHSKYPVIPCTHQVACAEIGTISPPQALGDNMDIRKKLTAVVQMPLDPNQTTADPQNILSLSSFSTGMRNIAAATSQALQGAEGEVVIKEEQAVDKGDLYEEVAIKLETFTDDDDFHSNLGVQDLLTPNSTTQAEEQSASTSYSRTSHLKGHPEGSCDSSVSRNYEDELEASDSGVHEGPSAKRRRLASPERDGIREAGAYTSKSLLDSHSNIPCFRLLREECLNQYEAFGIHVARELSQVGDEQSFRQAKVEINQIILKAKKGHYKES